MKNHLAAVALASCLTAATVTAQADEIYCPAVEATAHLTSQGELGVNIGHAEGEPPVFESVNPGDCFYDAALQNMRSVCGAFLEDPGSIDSSLGDGSPPQSKAEMQQAIVRLKRRVRSLRRQLFRQQKP